MNEIAIVASICASLGGQAEVTMPDNTRADCITDEHAYEADYGHKWAEAIGQSLHYAHMTGLQPGIIIIDATEAEFERLRGVQYYWGLPITIISRGLEDHLTQRR